MENDTYKYKYNKDEFIVYPVRLLRYLMKKMNLEKMFETHVRDPRYDNINYSSTSLLMMGLFVYLFRSTSKNNFYQPIYQGHPCRSLAQLAGLSSDRLPHISTIDNLFLMLNPKNLEPIPFAIVKWLLASKVLSYSYQSPLHLCIDAYCSHSYAEDSSHKPCSYCLPRQHGKTLRYYHINVLASIVVPGGFQLPLCIHRLTAQYKLSSLSNAKFKQQCELTALGPILSTIRSYLPRVKFCLLLDALYGNNTGITLAEAHDMQQFRVEMMRKRTANY